MSGLNTFFVPLTILQEQFWDKLTDAPMAGGVLYFYQDEARTIPKDVYSLSGYPPDYENPYPSIGSSVILSSIGTVDDDLRNNLVIYGYPYDDTEFDGSGNVQLYYMTVYNADGQFQFDVGGFPNIPIEGEPLPTGAQEKNFIKNGQFVINYGTQAISATTTDIAYGGWDYVRSSNTATDTISFYRFGSPIQGGIPSANPRYACNAQCIVPGSDSLKAIEIRFEDVNRFSDTAQTLSFFFMAKSPVNSVISVNLYKYFGSGGSTPISTQIVANTTLGVGWQPIEVSFPFGSNVGQTIGAGNDDYFSLQVICPPANTFNVFVTDFVLYLGTELITAYPFGPDSYNDQQIYNILTYVPATYTATLSGGFSLNATITTFQPITGVSITVPPGIYLLSYTCSLKLHETGGTAEGLESCVYNTTTNTLIPATQQSIAGINFEGTFSSYVAGNASVTTVVKVSTTTTFQVYGLTQFTCDSLVVTYATISALYIGSIFDSN